MKNKENKSRTIEEYLKDARAIISSKYPYLDEHELDYEMRHYDNVGIDGSSNRLKHFVHLNSNL